MAKDELRPAAWRCADPYNIKQSDAKAKLAGKMRELKALARKTKLPGTAEKLAQIETLPIYSETEEVAKILKEILADLATRLSVINEVDMQAHKLVGQCSSLCRCLCLCSSRAGSCRRLLATAGPACE